MMKRRLTLLIVAAAMMALAAGAALAQHRHDHDHASLPGDVVHAHALKEPPKNALFGYDLSGYTAAQRKAVAAEALRTPCGCGRGMSVAACLVNDRTCLWSPPMANAIIERVARKPYEEIVLDRSLTDGDVPGVAMKSLPAAQAEALAELLRKAACPGCGRKALDCLRDDPFCKASPRLLMDAYRKTSGSALPGAEARKASSKTPPLHDALPGHDISSLSEKKQKRVLDAANARPCLCGCGMTLAQCRNEDPTCEVSPRLVNALIFSILNEEEVEE